MGCNSSGYIRDFTLASTSYLPGAAAEHAATLKKQKYAALSQKHEFVPFAIETSGVFNSEGLEFVKKIERRIYNVSSDKKRDRLHVPANIRRNPEREQYLIFWIF